VRISVQIIDAKSDKHVWAENFDRTLDDIFAIQSEIAENVASTLKIELLQQERKEIGKESTASVEAHTIYLQGRFNYHKLTKASLQKAIQCFEQAVAIDPDFALAYSELANCYSLLGFFEMEPPGAVFPKAKYYASKAIETDSSLSEAHVAVGLVLFIHEWNFAQAEREYRRAIELNPSSASAHLQLSNLLENLGRFNEAIDEVNRALELDPIAQQTLQLAGTMYLYARRYDEATLLLKKVLELEPSHAMAHDNLGLALVFNGMIDEGIIEIEHAIRLSNGSNHAYSTDLVLAYVRAGKRESAESLLKEAIKQYDEKTGSATTLAMMYSVLGQKEEAFKWLERAYVEHTGYLISSYVEFTFDNLRSDPRFSLFMKKIGLN
jgi:adenylate cyclase